MTGTERLKQVRTLHPYPWRQVTHHNGRVQVLDAAGNEVGLFEMTAFLEIITASWNANDKKG